MWLSHMGAEAPRKMAAIEAYGWVIYDWELLRTEDKDFGHGLQKEEWCSLRELLLPALSQSCVWGQRVRSLN